MEIITDSGTSIPLGTSKISQVLALLVARAGEVVSVDTLVEELWGDRPPKSALTTLQTYVYHARRMFAQNRLTDSDRNVLLTRPPGYLLDASVDETDATRFQRLLRQGTESLHAERWEEASEQLRDALALFRGSAFASVSMGTVLSAHAANLEELRTRAIELRIEAQARLGRHREMVPELQSLVIARPLNEWFYGQLMVALHRCGRRAEALEVYQRLRRVVRDELGVEPSAEVQRLHRVMLEPVPQRAPETAASFRELRIAYGLEDRLVELGAGPG
ncbi:DNA-binding SARP family transcriptional activator [Micromonospora jinlongensis]|uniref:DNA-binding SARP family transcriptional activator n=1 Tax=Micromonospora jinlongensis TaxID=1287877 RepID=A0A7Y9WZU7_9ACTN|nr:AfsR/SARP family transcriptional regulator [Micromonospora jinlongensis]NYH41857.1 DNA-binding SARP family transcriptional activator [Micromonospora jinlongensis]